jgi:YebC/PmpR family DNA-binding regulatory protein
VGPAILVEALTDNRNRTGSDVRHAFEKEGGSLGEPGSVGYLFEKRGVILVDGERYGEDDLIAAIDAGAEDVASEGDLLKVVSDAGALSAVREALDSVGVEIESADLTMEPTSEVTVAESDAPALMRLIDALEDHDDVEAVHSNFDVPDEVLERAAS